MATLKIVDLSFNPSDYSLEVTPEIDRFIVLVTNNISRIDYAIAYPIIDGVEYKNFDGKRNPIFGTYVKKKSAFIFNKLDLIEQFKNQIGTNEKDIKFRVYFKGSTYNSDLKGYLDSDTLKIDNRDVTISVAQQVTPGSLAIARGANNHILFPKNGSDVFNIFASYTLDANLDSSSKNYYQHIFVILWNLGQDYDYRKFISPNAAFSFEYYEKFLNSIERRSGGKQSFIAKYFEVSDNVKRLGTDLKDPGKKLYVKFPQKIIYAWQHQYNFIDTRLTYNADDTNFNWWQIDNSKTLNLNIKATKDSRFNDTYDGRPWPLISYKVKVFAKKLELTDTLFNNNGYSSLIDNDQLYLRDLFQTNYENDTYKFVKKYPTGVTPADAPWGPEGSTDIDRNVTIDPANDFTSASHNDTEFHIYIIAKDELNFYQGIYLNQAMNNTGTVTEST